MAERNSQALIRAAERVFEVLLDPVNVEALPIQLRLLLDCFRQEHQFEVSLDTVDKDGNVNLQAWYGLAAQVFWTALGQYVSSARKYSPSYRGPNRDHAIDRNLDLVSQTQSAPSFQ